MPEILKELETSMLTKGKLSYREREEVLGCILDHATPKANDEGGQAYTLNSRDSQGAQVVITSNYIEVELETLKRKYDVDIPKLIECLNQHKTMSLLEIAERLNKPKTMVEHWFRKDQYFAIPDADIWMELKALLNIETTEFDESIMTFEADGSKYDMSGRIYTGETSPTIITDSKNSLYLIPTAYDGSTVTSPTNAQKPKPEECHTLSTDDRNYVILENQPTDSRIKVLKDVVQTLTGRMGTGGGNTPMVMESSVKQAEQEQYENLVVRRLTPTECGRLQGYPDGWMDIGEWKDSKGKIHKESDAPKYKAAGNSIALPFWQWLMDKIGKQLRKDGNENPTMASLFDGISGFPLCAARVGIEPVWSSEIEEFPIAVAEKHFGENGDIEKFL